MKTNVLLFFLLFLSFRTTAQHVELINLPTNDRIFHGQIDDQYDITLYLRVERHSEQHGAMKTLSGWYQYDRIGKPIPLAGTIAQNLNLFTSDNADFLNDLQNFTYQENGEEVTLDDNIFEMEEKMNAITGFTERFKLGYDDNQIKGIWTNGKKKLPVTIWSNVFNLDEEKQFLKLPNGSYFNLDNAEQGLIFYELQATANRGRNVLLSFSYPANLNYGGRCGGAINSGMTALIFDENYHLASIKHIYFESCYQEMYIDDEIEISGSITDFRVHDYNGDVKKTYRVDYNRATLKETE